MKPFPVFAGLRDNLSVKAQLQEEEIVYRVKLQLELFTLLYGIKELFDILGNVLISFLAMRSMPRSILLNIRLQ